MLYILPLITLIGCGLVAKKTLSDARLSTLKRVAQHIAEDLYTHSRVLQMSASSNSNSTSGGLGSWCADSLNAAMKRDGAASTESRYLLHVKIHCEEIGDGLVAGRLSVSDRNDTSQISRLYSYTMSQDGTEEVKPISLVSRGAL